MRNKILSVIFGCVTLLSVTAKAQFDYFAQPRTIQVISTANMKSQFTNISTGTLVGQWTNSIDTHGFDGIAKLDFFVYSNKADGSVQAFLTNSIVTSPDNTNWTVLTTSAITTNYTATYTNSLYGTNLIVSDLFLLPGTVTAVNAGTAGYTPPSANLLGINYFPFTTTAAFNHSVSGVYEYGFNISDAQRYIGIVTSLNGSNATYNVQAVLTGRKASGALP